MSIKRLLKYLMSESKYSIARIGVFIVIAQILVFSLASYYLESEIACLSLIPIVCFSFVFGELWGLVFATVIGLCFSPLWINFKDYGSAWWIFRTLSYDLVALSVGFLGRSLKHYILFEEEIRFKDIFMELPNKQALCRKLTDMSKMQKSGNFALVVVVISNSKTLSETFGNEVLKSIFKQFRDRCLEIARRISYEADVYSLDSDKMAFFFKKSEGNSSDEREKFETGLINMSKKNFLHDGFFVHGDCHLGLYRFSDFSEINYGELPLSYAEEAVDIAIKQMQDLVVYGPSNLSQKSKYSKASDILGEIDLAIRSRWMFLVYQPKIDIATGKIPSVEALIRWNHPVKGFVPPNMFIPQAEQSTLIENITDFVIRQAILQLKLWQRSGIYVNIAINISTYNLLQPNFVNKVLYLLSENKLPPESLEIEITEGALISDFQHVLDGLKRFHDARIKIALDDFGTGYSSLQYLQKLPIDYLKIDQSFVRNLGTGKESKEIVKAIVDLAHSINVKTIAEGIETMADYEYLSNVNCDMGQGFFMSKPLSSNTFVSWYSENNGVYKCK
ncbi:MAG: EAL domain-containing protein [Candidatus Fibromonas sp.]|nr:EAL domain-containing protein [Candidatus Fibromonas sp.]